jgi:hypothetical protein
MRARNLKPSLFRNELLAVADPLYTIVFQGLWCMADREGRLEDRPAKIHFDVNPGRAFDGTERSLAWLAENGFIERYEVAGRKLIQVVNFGKHQNPHCKESPSTIPAPCKHGASTVPARLIPDSGFLTADSGYLNPDSLRSHSGSTFSASESERAPQTLSKSAEKRKAVANLAASAAKAMQ